MIYLQTILKEIQIIAIKGNVEQLIVAIKDDSRKVEKGDLFVAVKGTQIDAHQYIEQVIEKGAVAIVCEQMPEIIHADITYIQVKSSTQALGIMAHHYYGDSTHQLQLIGITGTNGKTTIATLLYQLFTQLGYRCGLISTVENRIIDEVLPATHTTPDILPLNQLLQQMQRVNCAYVFMECSSHAIEQNRIAGLKFAGVVFTNLTHDHLDYHITFEKYLKAKKTLFDNLTKDAFALTNIDDKNGKVMIQNCPAQHYSYSLQSNSNFKAKILNNGIDGLHLKIHNKEVQCRMLGDFNAYNILAVYAVAMLLHQKEQDVLMLLSNLIGAKGRMEVYQSPKEKIMAIIDYAHTPDALENVLCTIRKMSSSDQQIITMVGCGGNRDRSKRSKIGKVACHYSSQVIFTADNPRDENVSDIIAEMQMDLDDQDTKKVLTIENRESAIKTALTLASYNSIVLVAGKGHETYQVIGNTKLHFDDKEQVLKYFTILDK